MVPQLIISIAALTLQFVWASEAISSPKNVRPYADNDLDALRASLSQSPHLLLFHAAWCGACRSAKPHIDRFAIWALSNQPELRIATISHEDGQLLFGRFGITRLPTLLHWDESGGIRDVSNQRLALEGLFINEDALKDIKVASSIWNPFGWYGALMTAVFKQGMRLVAYVDSILNLPKSQLIIVFLLLGGLFIALLVFTAYLYIGLSTSSDDDVDSDSEHEEEEEQESSDEELVQKVPSEDPQIRHRRKQ